MERKTIWSDQYALLLQHWRKARKAAKVTQRELAKRLGRTQTWVCNCERGERRIDAIELREFCRAIGVSYADFIRDLDAAIERTTGLNEP